MKIYHFVSIILLTAFLGCQNTQSTIELKTGSWIGAIDVDLENADNYAPFNMKINYEEGSGFNVVITNDTEVIEVSEVELKGDSVFMYMPVFQNKIIGRLVGDSIIGTYIKPTYSMPFFAVFGETDRFYKANLEAEFDLSGRWKILENPGQETENLMVGEFIQQGNKLTGTFLTVLGDYRYLEGKVSGNQMMLSCFDGAHSLMFKANIASADEMTEGLFRGSPSWRSNWVGIRDEHIVLPDAGDLTFIKDGYEKLEFSLQDVDGNYVSLSDEKFQDKAVIVQILGTWCPNCMDETKYLAGIYDTYKDQGLEIIALCFELRDYDLAKAAIKRFKSHNKANYTFLYAGPADKEKAAKVLPMLNKIISYPTAIFISKNKEVRKIHTGFSGPGTGVHHEELNNEFVSVIEALLKE